MTSTASDGDYVFGGDKKDAGSVRHMTRSAVCGEESGLLPGCDAAETGLRQSNSAPQSSNSDGDALWAVRITISLGGSPSQIRRQTNQSADDMTPHSIGQETAGTARSWSAAEHEQPHQQSGVFRHLAGKKITRSAHISGRPGAPQCPPTHSVAELAAGATRGHSRLTKARATRSSFLTPASTDFKFLQLTK